MDSQSQDKSIQSVLAAERAWTEAHQPLNVSSLADILSEEFTKLQADGSILRKSELLASYRSGDRHWDLAESSDHQVRVKGDTALVIGKWRARGTNNGAKFDYSARFLAVYVKDQDGWKMLTESSIPLSE